MIAAHLKSQVGRRLFLRFLLAALLPMGGVAWYAYAHVSELLLESTYHRLGQDSKTFGMSMLAELSWRSKELKRAAESPSPGGSLPYGFIETHVASRLEDSGQQQRAIERGGIVLTLPLAGPAMMATAIPGTNETLVGLIDTKSLWENDSAPDHYCVLNTQLAPFFCSAGWTPPGASALGNLMGSENRRVFSWRSGQNDQLVGFWQIGYVPGLNSQGFVVIVAASKAEALGDLEHFRQLFPAIVLLAVALAAGLAISQIQRQMKPLESLTDATRRLASGDLATRVSLSGDDEFARLGKDFNGMAGNLEYKFHMLRMLGELDRAILGASEMGLVVRDILVNVTQATPCDAAGLIRHSSSGSATLFTCPHGKADQQTCEETLINGGNLPAFDDKEAWHSFTASEIPPEYRQLLPERKIERVLAFPVRVEGKPNGILLLAYTVVPRDMEGSIQAGRLLADRVAIASASFAWKEKLYHQAHYDSLTDLPNRVLLRDRVEQAIIRAARNETSVALLLIDLDNFKQVNDTLGHSAGDRLLVEYAHRLRQRVREGDTVARLGGDEFVVLVSDLGRSGRYEALDNIARGLNEALGKPLMVNGQQIVSQASIGIALYPDNAAGYDELLKMADVAMYESKRHQPGGTRFYSSEIDERAQAHFELIQELREAVARNELVVHFQPKIDTETRRLAGAEALVRWNSPKRGLVPPGIFVHLLDEMGLGTWLGGWMLDAVCATMHEWDEMGLTPMPVSVNFSPLQFERTPVLHEVKSTLEKYKLAPSRLELEILEATAVSESLDVRNAMIQLRELGVSIALDDFGTGYSSLVYLARIPANVLKLDRGFIRTLTSDDRQRGIVKLIISLAKLMNFNVVAEGVEDEEQLGLLAQMGCDQIQGYLVSRPITADEFQARWLR